MTPRFYALVVSLAALSLFAAADAAVAQSRVGDTSIIYNTLPNVRFPEIAYDAVADAYLVAWQVSNVQPRVRFVAANGTPLGTGDNAASKAALSVGVACGVQGGSDICLIAWLEEKAVTNPPTVMGRLLRYSASAGSSVAFLTDPFVVNQNGLGKEGEYEPAVAYSATSNEFLVAWVDGGANIKGQRVTGAGALAGTEIAIAATTAWEGQSVVTWNSSANEFLVAYMYESNKVNIAVQRVGAGTGELIGGRNTVLTTTTDASPEIAYNSTANEYLLLTYSSLWVVNAMRLDSAGSPLAATPATVASSAGGPNMGLAYNPVANQYFAVFQHHDDVDTYGTGITAQGLATGAKFQITQPDSTRQAVEMSVAASTVATRWYAVESDQLNIKGQLIANDTVTPCTVTATATVPGSTTAGTSTSFTASSAVNGCDSATASYSWSFGDSGTSTQQSTTHSYSSAGTYTWTLTATAGTGSDTKTGSITVAAAGTCAPSTAAVSASYPTSSPSLAAMWQATGVTATAGQLLTVSMAAGQTWVGSGVTYTAAGNSSDVVSGADVPLSGGPRMALVGRIGTSGTPFLVSTFYQATASESGELYLAANREWYSVTNNSGSLTVGICTGGTACAATATATVPATAAPGNAVSFAGSCSPSGCGVASATYLWNFGDGSTSSSQSPAHTYAAEGSYTWTFSVWVGNASDTKTGTIAIAVPTCTTTVSTVLAGPTASWSTIWQSSGVTITSGEAVNIAASGTWASKSVSYTADGSGSVGDAGNVPLASAANMALVGRIGTSGTPFLVGASKALSATSTGLLYFAPNHEWYLLAENSGSLSVSTCNGASTCTVTATATVPVRAVAGRSVSFAAASTLGGSCASAASYSWAFGDGSTSSSQNPTHAYAAAGTYNWTLTATAGSASTTKTGTISVRVAGLPADFDGDGKSDVAVFRPSTSTWFSLDSSAANTAYRYRGWGSQSSGDVPVIGDFDGDGLLDPTVFRPASGTWFILESQYNFTTVSTIGWGESADTVVPGDYDGDGKTDCAVYRPSTGTWYIRPSSGAAQWSVVFGQAGDIPVAGDYDGDGKRDPAVYRPSTGTWFWLKSSASYATFGYRGWGINDQGDTPVPGDYDGDGVTDLCVFRPAAGTWYVLESHASYTTWSYYGWGTTGDQVAPADYDGDGKTDYAIYRPSTFTWYVRPSGGASQWNIVFGASSDVPLVSIK
jgi:PKD repeat protein